MKSEEPTPALDASDASAESTIAPERVTVAVEGWNAGDLGGRDAFHATLQSLCSQTYPFAQCEVLVLIDSSAPADEESWLQREVPGARVVRVAHATYYRVKNRALSEAHGDVLVLADSDVRYEPHWLESILASFQPGIDVVVGYTRFEPGFWSRTQSLCDWNATRPRSGPTQSLYGNNLALRRSLYRRVLFREDMGRGGGGAMDLVAEGLLAEGVVPWFCAEAKGVHHLGSFVHRRLRNGAYLAHHRKIAHFRRLPWLTRIPLLGAPLVVAGTMVRAWVRAWTLRSTLPARGFSLPAYWISIAAVKSLEVVGAVLYQWAPGSVLNRWDWYATLAVEPISITASGPPS